MSTCECRRYEYRRYEYRRYEYLVRVPRPSPRLVSVHFFAVVTAPPEGSYTQYSPVLAHLYASCTPGVRFSFTCSANPSRRVTPR